MDRGHETEIDQVEPVGNLGGDELPGEELIAKVQRGDVTSAKANDELQGAARRHAAEHGPDLDTDEDGMITGGGFGSGQGMASHSTGGRNQKGTIGGRT